LPISTGAKQINDASGHAAGDTVIMQTGAILKSVFRESDVIARIGGDEFAVLALQALPQSSEIIEYRLQKQIEAHNEKADTDRILSVSCGVVTVGPAPPPRQ